MPHTPRSEPPMCGHGSTFRPHLRTPVQHTFRISSFFFLTFCPRVEAMGYFAMGSGGNFYSFKSRVGKMGKGDLGGSRVVGNGGWLNEYQDLGHQHYGSKIPAPLHQHLTVKKKWSVDQRMQIGFGWVTYLKQEILNTFAINVHMYFSPIALNACNNVLPYKTHLYLILPMSILIRVMYVWLQLLFVI